MKVARSCPPAVFFVSFRSLKVTLVCLLLLTKKATSLSSGFSRAKFLSSSAASFLASSWVWATDPQSCDAAAGGTGVGGGTSLIPGKSSAQSNPRYIERQLEMTYAEGPDGNPRSRGILVRRFTGDSTPYSFPVTPVRLVMEWPEEPPFKPEDFFRSDENSDSWFYGVPRLVYHVDEAAVSSLVNYYRRQIKPKSDILDICSSWVSHYPLEFPDTMGKICGTGMNPLELQFNDQLTGGFKAANLNDSPVLPYDDQSFDVVTCVVSIDYLIHPIEVLKECHRVLRPGGQIIISQSNRCFPSKAIAMWLKMNDRQHLELINGYLKYAGGYKYVQAFDITATVPGNAYRDPMFVVQATRV